MLLAALLTPSPATAQHRSAPGEVHPGERIRVVAPEFDHGRRTGTYEAVRGDTLFMAVRGDPHAIALSGLQSIEVSVGRDRAGGAFYGGAVGALGAGLVRGLLSAGGGSGDYGSTGGAFAHGFIVGVQFGLLLGVPVGAIIGIERWERTDPAKLH